MLIGLVALGVAFAQPVQVETTVLEAEQSTTCITVDVAPATLECQHVQTIVTREILRSPTYRSPAMRSSHMRSRGLQPLDARQLDVQSLEEAVPPIEQSEWSRRIQRTRNVQQAQPAQQTRGALPVTPLQRPQAEPVPAAVPAGFIQPVVPGVVGFGVTPVGLVSPEDIVPMGSMGSMGAPVPRR